MCAGLVLMQLAITSTPNQDNPLMEGAEGEKMIPILGLDVWVRKHLLRESVLSSRKGKLHVYEAYLVSPWSRAHS